MMTPSVWLALSASHPIHNVKQPATANAAHLRRRRFFENQRRWKTKGARDVRDPPGSTGLRRTKAPSLRKAKAKLVVPQVSSETNIPRAMGYGLFAGPRRQNRC